MVNCTPSITDPAPSPNAPGTPQPELYVCPFTIVEDKDEKAPWTFSNIIIDKKHWIPLRKRQKLKTADYTIEGMESCLCIERKSSSDLIGSITCGNRRFKAEHERMLAVVDSGGFSCVIIEGSFSTIHDDLISDWKAGRPLSPEILIGCTASWPARYQVPWFFAGDRRRAELLAFRIMVKQWERKNDD